MLKQSDPPNGRGALGFKARERGLKLRQVRLGIGHFCVDPTRAEALISHFSITGEQVGDCGKIAEFLLPRARFFAQIFGINDTLLL